MSEYKITTNPIEFFSGTTNIVSSAYTEAVAMLENVNVKSMSYLKNFVTSIEDLASREGVRDERLSKSKGNVQKFSGYNNIKVGLDFLSKNIPNEELIKNLKDILRALETNQTSYIDGYSKHIRIIILEYEASLYMLVTGISFALASYTDIQQNGAQVKIVKKSGGKDKGVIAKTIRELAKELNTKDHTKYLEELVKAKDSVAVSTKVESVAFTEAAVSETIDLIKSIWNGLGAAKTIGTSLFKMLYRTMFGIIPLIRSALYLKYKRKADTILSLEEQIQFIEMNIDQLKNIKTMDETKKAEIIKKQQAVIEAYKKKSEKLRAELIETEKEAVVAIKENDPVIKKKDPADDFILD